MGYYQVFLALVLLSKSVRSIFIENRVTLFLTSYFLVAFIGLYLQSTIKCTDHLELDSSTSEEYVSFKLIELYI